MNLTSNKLFEVSLHWVKIPSYIFVSKQTSETSIPVRD